jgi:glycosyltransferase involved in cell wall biosynthesis
VETMRVLMLSKACLAATYQSKLEEIGRFEDVDLTVIVPAQWNDPAGPVQLERGSRTGYRLVVDPLRFNGNFHLHYYPRLKKRLAEFQPDIVHIDEEPYNLATWLARRQARAAGAKTIFFTWQNIYRRYPFPFSKMESQVLQGVDYAIMGNQEAAAVWQKKGYTGPFQVIPQFGVDPDVFHPPAYRDSGRGFVIGSANRRLVPEKGIDVLLHAAAKLSSIWRVLIAGEGPERPYLEQLAGDLGIKDRVHFESTISSSQMPAFLQQLDVLVLSSRTLPNWKEQFGRVLVEAMACEVPVIGSNSGEIPHVIGDGGLIFAEDDVAGLGEHLLKLMQAEDHRQKLGRLGRKRVLAMYTQAQIAAQTVAIYREMME